MALKIKVKQESDPIIWKFLIEPEWNKIKDLEKYLKEVFNLNEIHLMDDDGYLHPKSNINYVRWMSENNEILTITSVIRITPPTDIRPTKRKKLANDDLDSEYLKNTNKTKIILEKSDLIYNEIIPAVKSLVNKNDKQMKLIDNSENNMKENIITQSNQNIDNDSTENEIQVKKSKKRKRRKKRNSIEEQSELLHVNSLLPEKKSKTNEKINKDSKENSIINENKSNPFKKHFHFDDSGEVVIENNDSKIKFIDYLNDLDSEKPRFIKPVIVHLNNDITNGLCHGDIQSETDSNKFIENDEESSRTFIGPQISDEFLNHKLEKWEDFENYSYADTQTVEKDSPNICKTDQPKIIIISNEIISNGIDCANEII